jgi:hypothetical protein
MTAGARSWCLGVSAVVLLTMAAAGQSSPARAGPVQRERLSSPGPVDWPVVAVDARGDATAAWLQGTALAYTVMVSTRDARAPGWSHPVAVGSTTGGPGGLSLAVSRSGAAVVAWQPVVAQNGGDVGVLEAAVRASADASWSAPQQVSPAGQAVGQSAVGVDSSGHALAIWTAASPGSAGPLVAARGDTATGVWDAPTRVGSDAQGGLDPVLTVNAEGDAIAVWHRSTGHVHSRGRRYTVDQIIGAEVHRGGRWSAATGIGRALTSGPGRAGATIAGVATEPLSLDARGDGIVVWQTWDHRRAAIAYAIKPSRAARWRRQALLARNGATDPVVGMDDRGDATAIWDDSHYRVIDAQRAVGARHWGWSTRLRAATGLVSGLAVDGRDTAVAAWLGARHKVMIALRHRRRGNWTRPLTLGSGQTAQAAISGTGEVAAIWLQFLGRLGSAIQVATT